MNVIAHRGNDGNHSENRVPLMIETLDKPYVDGIETDVRMTKDAKFIIAHNVLLKTSTSSYKSITGYTLKQLQKFTFKEGKRDYPIYTIEQLLEKVHTDKIIIIECKLEIGDYKKYAKSLLKILKKYKNRSIELCSFHYKLALQLKKKCPYFKVGLIIGYTLNDEKNYSLFDFISVHHTALDQKALKYPYYVWNVNNKEILHKIKKNKNFLGIITDYPKNINKM